jgi:hypothetical protein
LDNFPRVLGELTPIVAAGAIFSAEAAVEQAS